MLRRLISTFTVGPIQSVLTQTRYVGFGVLVVLFTVVPAMGGDKIEIFVDGQLLVTVNDGDFGVDLDFDANEIEVDMDVVGQIDASWVATGKIIAKGGGQIPITTVVTETLIESVANGVGGTITVVHHAISDPPHPQYFSSLDGQYENVLGQTISLAWVQSYQSFIDNESIGDILPPMAQNVPTNLQPVPFDGMSGPLILTDQSPLYQTLPVMTQTIRLVFYVDDPGDAIRLFDSAEIFPAPAAPADVPTLTEWGTIILTLLLVTTVTIAIGRRRTLVRR
jgi:hypothetical protein